MPFSLEQEKPSSKEGTQQKPQLNKDSAKEWTQEELDSFIAKNDWQSVSKYINEMRVSKNQHDRIADPSSKAHNEQQPSIREIQKRIEYNRSLEKRGGDSGGGSGSSPMPKTKFGARSQIQHDEISHEDSRSAGVESESVWQSLSSASYESSSGVDSSSYYRQREERQRQSSRGGRRRSSPREMLL